MVVFVSCQWVRRGIWCCSRVNRVFRSEGSALCRLGHLATIYQTMMSGTKLNYVRVRTSFRCSKQNILPQHVVLQGLTAYSKLQQLNIRITHFRLSLVYSPYCTIPIRFINDNLLYSIPRERA